MIIGVLVAIFLFGGHSIYYPTSSKAFIPKSLDSEYKEFKKFSQQELGRVLYARPLTEIEKNNLDEDSFRRIEKRYRIDNKDIFVGIVFVRLIGGRTVYVYIKELGYYGGWNKWTFNFLFFPNTTRRSYNSIDSITIDNSQIIQNKEIMGNLKKDKSRANEIYDIVIEGSLDELDYLNHLEMGYDYFKVLK